MEKKQKPQEQIIHEQENAAQRKDFVLSAIWLKEKGKREPETTAFQQLEGGGKRGSPPLSPYVH